MDYQPYRRMDDILEEHNQYSSNNNSSAPGDRQEQGAHQNSYTSLDSQGQVELLVQAAHEYSTPVKNAKPSRKNLTSIKNNKAGVRPKVKFGISALKDTKLVKPIHNSESKPPVAGGYGLDSAGHSPVAKMQSIETTGIDLSVKMRKDSDGLDQLAADLRCKSQFQQQQNNMNEQ